jgi:hypothetical protein
MAMSGKFSRALRWGAAHVSEWMGEKYENISIGDRPGIDCHDFASSRRVYKGSASQGRNW